MNIEVFNFAEKICKIKELHSFKVIAQMNNYYFRLVRARARIMKPLIRSIENSNVLCGILQLCLLLFLFLCGALQETC